MWPFAPRVKRTLTVDAFFDQIERALPGHRPRRMVEGDTGRLTWSNGDIDAGVLVEKLNGKTALSVFFSHARREIDSVADATDSLRAVFNDEIVFVNASAQGRTIIADVAPASNPTAAFPAPAYYMRGGRSLPVMDELSIYFWSGAGRPAKRG